MQRNSFCRMYVHLVFSTKSRFRLMDASRREALLRYMHGIIKAEKCLLYTGSVMPDHVHLLIGLHPAISLSSLTQKVKGSSSRYINEQHWLPFHFAWCDGYGAFSCSESVVEAVKGYIEHQEEHHRLHPSFTLEYRNLLLRQGVKEEELSGYHMTEDSPTPPDA